MSSCRCSRPRSQVEGGAGFLWGASILHAAFQKQPDDPCHEIKAWHSLRPLLPDDIPPLIADESVQQASDIPALAGGADGINIKLTKAGGLREARRMITLARTLGMQVMLGCSVESSVGITAAAHLAPLVDFADLDGNLNVANDPYAGVRMENGRLHLPQEPGLGVTRLAGREL